MPFQQCQASINKKKRYDLIKMSLDISKIKSYNKLPFNAKLRHFFYSQGMKLEAFQYKIGSWL